MSHYTSSPLISMPCRRRYVTTAFSRYAMMPCARYAALLPPDADAFTNKYASCRRYNSAYAIAYQLPLPCSPMDDYAIDIAAATPAADVSMLCRHCRRRFFALICCHCTRCRITYTKLHISSKKEITVNTHKYVVYVRHEYQHEIRCHKRLSR